MFNMNSILKTDMELIILSFTFRIDRYISNWNIVDPRIVVC